MGLGSLAIFIPIGCNNKQSGIGIQGESPLHYKTIVEISKMIKSKEISSFSLTQLMLDRIETVDTSLHSFLTVMKNTALERARELDKELEAGKYRGFLHGVPIAVKDLCYTKGVATTGGLKVLSDFVPDFDATVVSKLEAAGAVLLGKLNLTEGAWLDITLISRYRITPGGKICGRVDRPVGRVWPLLPDYVSDHWALTPEDPYVFHQWQTVSWASNPPMAESVGMACFLLQNHLTM